MATETIERGRWSAPDGQAITISWDQDDQTLIISAVRWNNPSTSDARVIITHLATGRTFARVLPAGTSQSVAVPTQPNSRLTHARNARGKLDGIEWSVQVPA
jgi:hypothetical protein